MTEPDYEAMAERRTEERDQTWLHRMDVRYGTVEQHRRCGLPEQHAGDR